MNKIDTDVWLETKSTRFQYAFIISIATGIFGCSMFIGGYLIPSILGGLNII